MECRFIVFADCRYLKNVESELASLFGNGIWLEEMGNGRFFLLTSRKAIAGTLSPSKFMFVENVLPIAHIYSKPPDERVLVDSMAAALPKKSSFRMEVLNIGLGSGERAKDLEVRVGSALEKKGFRADLVKPELYALICRSSGFSALSVAKAETVHSPVDAFRNQKKEASRSFYKLKEAFERFGIDKRKVRKALDIGGAPGGWTSFLSQFSKVVAVDGATLDYGRLPQEKSVVVVSAEKPLPQTRIAGALGSPVKQMELQKAVKAKRCDILHIKGSVWDSAESIRALGLFDFVAIDMNARPREAADAANLAAESLKKGAMLVMTIKFFDKDTEGSVRIAREALMGNFRDIRVKKLPHNRREATLYCIRR